MPSSSEPPDHVLAIVDGLALRLRGLTALRDLQCVHISAGNRWEVHVILDRPVFPGIIPAGIDDVQVRRVLDGKLAS